MGSPGVKLDVSSDTAFLTLCAPHKRNALARSVHHEIGAHLDEIRERDDIRFVVLAGCGGVFSSGGDLDELSAGLPSDYVDDYWLRMSKSVVALGALPQIVISVIEGAAIGAGAALALSADLVIAETDAKMRFSFVHLGFVPDASATWLLPRAVGYAVARDMLLTGREVTMREAHERGLVSRLAEPGKASEVRDALLDELRRAPGTALTLTKGLINAPERDALAASTRSEGATQPVAAAALRHQNT